LRYTVQSRIGGKLAQLGQRLVDGAAKSLAEDFFKRFEATFDAPVEVAVRGATDTSSQASAVNATGWVSVPIWAWGLASFVLALGVIFSV
jgi:hypothetical protein